MDYNLDDPPLSAELILNLIKNTLVGCKHSSSRGLLGFARGIEVGVSALQGARATSDSIAALRQRSLRLSQAQYEYHLGVALGIDVAVQISSAITKAGTVVG
jgi:hypothetical protein